MPGTKTTEILYELLCHIEPTMSKTSLAHATSPISGHVGLERKREEPSTAEVVVGDHVPVDHCEEAAHAILVEARRRRIRACKQKHFYIINRCQ